MKDTCVSSEYKKLGLSGSIVIRLSNFIPRKQSFEFVFYDYFTSTWLIKLLNQPAITCSKLTVETIEHGVNYVQSYQ